MKMNAYTANRRRNRWRDNSLETADENTSGKFDWYIIRKFRPYVGRYKWVYVEGLNLLPEPELRDLIGQSYKMVAAKTRHERKPARKKVAPKRKRKSVSRDRRRVDPTGA